MTRGIAVACLLALGWSAGASAEDEGWREREAARSDERQKQADERDAARRGEVEALKEAQDAILEACRAEGEADGICRLRAGELARCAKRPGGSLGDCTARTTDDETLATEERRRRQQQEEARLKDPDHQIMEAIAFIWARTAAQFRCARAAVPHDGYNAEINDHYNWIYEECLHAIDAGKMDAVLEDEMRVMRACARPLRLLIPQGKSPSTRQMQCFHNRVKNAR